VLGLVLMMAMLLGVILVAARTVRPRTSAAQGAVPAEPRAESPAVPADAPPAATEAPVGPAPSATAPAASPVAPPDLAAGVSAELRLRDGRTLKGVVDLVTASDIFVHDPVSGLPYGMPLVFVRDVRRENGEVVWRSPSSASVQAEETAINLRVRGVAGTYRVTIRAASIDGESPCRADVRWRDGRTFTERVAHVAGADSATLPDRPGVVLRLADDGRFAGGPTQGVQDATAWWFAMRGQFAPEGFTATSELRTATTLRWRKVQRCRVRADLAAVRVR
jgi:hypothetical protein